MDSLAKYYRHYNDETIYEAWLDYTLDQLDGPAKLALDIACGTGDFTALLADFVQEIYGIDIDPQMIKLAKTSFPQLDFYVQDMLDLNFPDRHFDLLTCYLDSLCFLPDEKAILKAFQEAYRVLQKGGLYLFDVWTPDQILSGFKDFSFSQQEDGQAMMWQSEVDEDQVKVTHHISVFTQVDQGLYRREDLTLRERAYLADLLVDLLMQAGFEKSNISYTGDLTDQFESHRSDQNQRWFFKAVK